MRNLPSRLVTTALLAAQVANPLHSPATASPAAPAAFESAPKSSIVFSLSNPDAVSLHVDRPNFDTEVLAPLRAQQAAAAQAAAQAAAAARLKALAASQAVRRVQPVVATLASYSGNPWLALRMCESGGTYTRNSGNGYYGAYQFDIGTWSGFGGYARADLAPPAVQDAKAQQTEAARGWSPWPACARRLGLL